MIEDLFFKRYKQRLFHFGGVDEDVQRVISQATHIFLDDVTPTLCLDEGFFLSAEQQLFREYGRYVFPPNHQSPHIRCAGFLMEQYSPWGNQGGDADLFVKLRLSLIELLFRNAERTVANPKPYWGVGRAAYWRRWRTEVPNVVRSAISELNARFRAAGVGLHYHNGLIQLAEDDLSQERIAEPFWSIVSDPRWANVDRDMKEAVDRADTGGRDAPLYAAKALESTIKIISDQKGWTTGAEKGAANYIDNLVSQKNGRFIDTWEAETLKALFKNIRNPLGHGPGSAPPPALHDHQVTWAIETCMSWIKSLIRRL